MADSLGPAGIPRLPPSGSGADKLSTESSQVQPQEKQSKKVRWGTDTMYENPTDSPPAQALARREARKVRLKPRLQAFEEKAFLGKLADNQISDDYIEQKLIDFGFVSSPEKREQLIEAVRAMQKNIDMPRLVKFLEVYIDSRVTNCVNHAYKTHSRELKKLDDQSNFQLFAEQILENLPEGFPDSVVRQAADRCAARFADENGVGYVSEWRELPKIADQQSGLVGWSEPGGWFGGNEEKKRQVLDGLVYKTLYKVVGKIRILLLNEGSHDSLQRLSEVATPSDFMIAFQEKGYELFINELEAQCKKWGQMNNVRIRDEELEDIQEKFHGSYLPGMMDEDDSESM